MLLIVGAAGGEQKAATIFDYIYLSGTHPKKGDS